eukprot:1896585-Rhodomonas_salina.2
MYASARNSTAFQMELHTTSLVAIWITILQTVCSSNATNETDGRERGGELGRTTTEVVVKAEQTPTWVIPVAVVGATTFSGALFVTLYFLKKKHRQDVMLRA